MSVHDDYGKLVLWHASERRADREGPSLEIDYGAGGRCRIDGTLDGSIAIEIESRTGKQVRGALLDLISHPFPKKLLLLMPVHMDVRIEVPRCRAILRKFHPEAEFRVVALAGTGHAPDLVADVPIVATALSELGFRHVS